MPNADKRTVIDQALNQSYLDYQSLVTKGQSPEKALEQVYAVYSNPGYAGGNTPELSQLFDREMSPEEKRANLSALWQESGIKFGQEAPNVQQIAAQEEAKDPRMLAMNVGLPMAAGFGASLVNPALAVPAFTATGATLRGMQGQPMKENLLQAATDMFTGGVAPKLAAGAAAISPVLKPVAAGVVGGAATVGAEMAKEQLGDFAPMTNTERAFQFILGGMPDALAAWRQGGMPDLSTIPEVETAMKNVGADWDSLKAVLAPNTSAALAAATRNDSARDTILQTIDGMTGKLLEKLRNGAPAPNPEREILAIESFKSSLRDAVLSDSANIESKINAALKKLDNSGTPGAKATFDDAMLEIRKMASDNMLAEMGVNKSKLFSELTGQAPGSLPTMAQAGEMAGAEFNAARQAARSSADAAYTAGVNALATVAPPTRTAQAIAQIDDIIAKTKKDIPAFGVDIGKVETGLKQFKDKLATGVGMDELGRIYRDLNQTPASSLTTGKVIGDIKSVVRGLIDEAANSDPAALQAWQRGNAEWEAWAAARKATKNVDAMNRAGNVAGFIETYAKKAQPGRALDKASQYFGVPAKPETVALARFQEAVTQNKPVNVAELKTIFSSNKDALRQIEEYTANRDAIKEFYSNLKNGNKITSVLLPGSAQTEAAKELAQKAANETYDWLSKLSGPAQKQVEALAAKDILSAVRSTTILDGKPVVAGINQFKLNELIADNPQFAKRTNIGQFLTDLKDGTLDANGLVKHAEMIKSLDPQDMVSVAKGMQNYAKFPPKDVAEQFSRVAKTLPADKMRDVRSSFVEAMGLKDGEFDLKTFGETVSQYKPSQLEAILGNKDAAQNVADFGRVMKVAGKNIDRIKNAVPQTQFQNIRTLLSLTSGVGAAIGLGFSSLPTAAILAAAVGFNYYPMLSANAILQGGSKISKAIELMGRMGAMQIPETSEALESSRREAPNGKQR